MNGALSILTGLLILGALGWLGLCARPLTQLRQHRWHRLGLAAAVTALVAVFVGVTMPRGPATANEALVVMGSSLAVGLLVGLLTGSRWGMLLAPTGLHYCR